MLDPRAPACADILIVGGGTSGAALAGLLARNSQASVVLLEAGPDYGAFADGGWPAELLDARRLPGSHGWNYTGLAHARQTSTIPFDRARVIGGCSSHNGCVALAGHRRDYDAWGELSNPGWDWASVAPAFERARTALRVRQVQPDEVSPFHGLFVEASAAAGLVRVDDLDNPDGVSEVGFSPVNICDGVRWNTALAYLDAGREWRNLRIVGDALVERVEVVGGRAVAVQLAGDAGPTRIEAERIVVSAGAYGSPAVLLRSGIGAPDELRALGIEPVHPLPGVGRSLQDHPAVSLTFLGSAELVSQMQQWRRERWLPDEQALAKARSRNCRDAFDIHVFSYAPTLADGDGCRFQVVAACVAPRSAGSVRLASADPRIPPLIDHGFLTDPDGHDLAVLHDAVDLAQTIIAGEPLSANLVAGEPQPIGLAERVGIYYHPSCSCRMGSSSDPLAVVDARARVHGLDNLYVCDASIFPRLMRANTNLPAAMLAEHLAPALLTSA